MKNLIGVCSLSICCVAMACGGTPDPEPKSDDTLDCGLSDSGSTSGGSPDGGKEQDSGSTIDGSSDAGKDSGKDSSSVCVPKSKQTICGNKRCVKVDDNCGNKVFCGKESACKACDTKYGSCKNECDEDKCDNDEKCEFCHEHCDGKDRCDTCEGKKDECEEKCDDRWCNNKPACMQACSATFNYCKTFRSTCKRTCEQGSCSTTTTCHNKCSNDQDCCYEQVSL